MNLPHLAQRLFNTPLALHPRKAEVVMAALADRLGIAHIIPAKGAWADDDDDGFSKAARGDKGYDTLAGMAVIAVHGTLVQKLGCVRPFSGLTGYDGIRQAFLSALQDPEVKGICLDIDSPGGEVAGCFDLVDMMYQSRGAKPVHAILCETAYSAAYAIASAADRIVVPRTGGLGSIGVIVLHVDWSQHLKSDGLQVTLITFGDRKADANPYTRLTDVARDGLQEEVNALGQLFVATVSRNRGMSEKTIRATQAACFRAADGVSLGLSDAVAPPDIAFRELMNTAGV